MSKRKCKFCNKSIAHKHQNAKFCCLKHKDKYHNLINPRGFYQPTVDGVKVQKGYSGLTDQEHDQIMNDLEQGWDTHKEAF